MEQNQFQGDFLSGHEVWLKQSKQFFEQSLPLLDRFFSSSFTDVDKALFALDEMIYYFKAQIKSQGIFFHFIPPISSQHQGDFPQYFSLLSDMTDEVVDLLHEKMREKIKNNSSPQSMREFYELWLECSDQVYQKWLHSDKFLSAFGEIMNKMFA